MSTDQARWRDELPTWAVESLGEQADPWFRESLRMELRARAARQTRQLWWFEMETPGGLAPIVHDGQLVHLATNDLSGFAELCARGLGFVPEPRHSPAVERDVAAVFAGQKRGTEVAYLGALGEFQRRVLQTTASIPRGEVRPYGWVAREAGSPGAMRAAGTALAHNPVPFIVPCHRVVRNDWTLGQYSGGGTVVKDRILRVEGVDVERLMALSARRVRLEGTVSTHTFCLPTCQSGGSADVETVVQFRDEAEARRAGYRPCELCRPASCGEREEGRGKRGERSWGKGTRLLRAEFRGDTTACLRARLGRGIRFARAEFGGGTTAWLRARLGLRAARFGAAVPEA